MLDRLRRIFLAPLLAIHLVLTSWFAIEGDLRLAWILFFASVGLVLIYRSVEQKEQAHQMQDARTASFTRIRPALAASGISGLSLGLCLRERGYPWPLAVVAAVLCGISMPTIMLLFTSRVSPGQYR